MAEELEQNEEIELTPDEEQAAKHGWTPKEQWVADGNPEEKWFDAKTFNIRGDFISDLKKRDAKIDELQSSLSEVKTIINGERERAYNRGLADAEARHAKAVEEGDVEGAKQALDDVREISQQKPAPVNNDAIVQKWIDENPDVYNNPDGWAEAEKLDKFLSRNGPPEDMNAHMAEVTRQAKERLMPKNTARDEPPLSDSSPSRTLSKSSGEKKFTRDDLDDASKEAHDKLVKSEVMTSEEYIQSLVEIGALQ